MPPAKRNRKDSDQSTGSNASTSCSSASNNGGDFSPCRGACSSSSSGSVGSENEEAVMKTCCFPPGCPYGEDASSPEHMMVKVICNYDACPVSQFMHADCFNHWEEGILNCLRSYGRARSWSEKQRRQNLWTKKGYDLAYRACVCKCKHGHLRKDLEWNPQTPAVSDVDQHDSNAKKKNRRKHKDLPSLGGSKFNVVVNKTKSKPIPGSNDSRMRSCSSSSTPSVDQGYSSSSPCTTENGAYVFSPPSSHYSRNAFSFHNFPMHRTSNGYGMSSASPLPEIPDDDISLLSPQLISSPTPVDSSLSFPSTMFLPPMSPDVNESKVHETSAEQSSDFLENEIRRLFPKPQQQRHVSEVADVQAMTALIDSLRCREMPEASASAPYSQLCSSELVRRSLLMREQDLSQMMANDLNQLRMQDPTPYVESHPMNCSLNFPTSQLNGMQLAGNFLEMNGQNLAGLNNSNKWANVTASRYNDQFAQKQNSMNPNQQLMLALRQKEQRDMEKRELNKYILSMMSSEENKTQVITLPHDKNNQHAHTEVRLVPMRSTTFAKRYDFSAFERVLPSQHINPYRIKMEGEGYGSDDLRNFILASLSKAKCSQMNCVMCGIDLPVYDHFPLVDGTMFLSPEKNERNTRNCFKIKVEGKCEFVHAVCVRCLEGLHSIVCRMCNSRWEGLHHQLGTLYMYDIFAANPCCQRRLCCKQCGSAVVDLRQGLKFFSDYSKQKTCPYCHALDHHFVHPISSFQLMGLVFS